MNIKTIEHVIAEYMRVLDGHKLPEELWKAIADLNGELLNVKKT